MKKWIAPLLLIVVVGFFLLRWLVQQVSPRPDHLGAQNGRFTPCPDSPNCVSSFADPSDDEHYIEPLPLESSLPEAKVRIYNIVADMPRSRIVTNAPNYIHAEFRSLTWGFVDDVEFYFDEEAGLIHVKSAARLGEGDMGANRNRVEEIRELYGEGR
jgi:uncharacterized protein (DUF1499 family)